MKPLAVLLFLCLLAPVVQAQPLAQRGTVLDHLTGNWVMAGPIDGQETVHDVTAEWVLGGHYLYLHDRARELDENGSPAYEARIYIGWDEAGARLVCLWLDVTGGGGLVPDGFGYGAAGDDRIPFVWGGGSNAQIHNTFGYQSLQDQWTWQIDNVRDGVADPFARVVLTRAETAKPAGVKDYENILEAIARLSAATLPGGGGADAYGAGLSEDFSRWTLPRGQVEGRKAFIDGMRSWLNDGWRVASRESQMIDSTIIGNRAYTQRVVTESYSGPHGARSGPATFSIEETWKQVNGAWLLHRATVYPVAGSGQE